MKFLPWYYIPVYNKMRFNLGFCTVRQHEWIFFLYRIDYWLCACASCDNRNYFLLELFGLVIGESPACLASRLVTKFWLIKRWSFSNLSDDRNSCLLLCSFLSSCLCLQEVPQHFSILFSLLMIGGMLYSALKYTKSALELIA